ncbi:MAG: hypothetical protein II392_00960 [Mycoplasma sp.]|nr:hypothetical protein [Mycoplasma sp.]
MLKGMGLTDEQVDAIIEEHASAKDNLKVKIKSLEEQLKDSEEIRNKYNDLADDVKKNNWKDKFDNLSKEFKEYKQEIENSRIQESKKEAYKNLLIKNGISEKQLSAILEVTKYDDIEIDENGDLKDAKELENQIKDKWGGFIVKTHVEGLNTENPPTNLGGASKEEILNIKDPVERQEQIAKNLELFNNW